MRSIFAKSWTNGEQTNSLKRVSTGLANTKELTMPTIDEAIERAARAAWVFEYPNVSWDGLGSSNHSHLIAIQRAALSAFLADVPVSEGMENVGGDVAFTCSDINPDELRGAFKAMCAKLAEEIQ